MTTPPTNLAGLLLFPVNFWGAGPITFSVPKDGSAWSYSDEPNASGYSTLTVGQVDRFLTAITAWDRLIAPSMVRTDDLASPGAIRIAFTNYSEIQDSWGYAYIPPFQGGAGGARNGDIWINSDYKTATFAAGSYDFSSMLHEIGHTLGLTHPHDVTAWPAGWDSGEWTVMSYHDDYGRLHRSLSLTAGGSLIPTTQGVYTSTPMVVDIAAVQQRYGADTTTATGNDTYTFSMTTPFMMSIYDAGGIDTIDLSSHTRGSEIDLQPGAYSSIAKFTIDDQVAAYVAQFGANYTQQITNYLNLPETYTWTNNLGIAFSTTIENAIGGSGLDRFTGNDANNTLEGRGGADQLFGMVGDDVLWGGDGDDRMVGGAGFDILFGDAGDDTATFDFIFADGGVVPFGPCILIGGEGIDFVADMEVLIFKDGTIDRRDNDILVDDLYYYGVYHDIWVAKIDADSHYKAGGWKEGRNPNQFFDTKAYLAAYADARDAAAQGMDPMTHYLTIGWKKGHDPSGLFDTSAYLAAYTDVAAAGVNPLVHYLTSGIEQFRNTFGDGVLDP